MSHKGFTLLLIPEGSDKVRRVHMRALWLKAALAIMVCGFVLTSALAGYYYATRDDRSKLMALKQSSSLQEDEMIQLQASMSDLRRQLILLQQTDAKLRMMARLEPPKPEGLVGIGGASAEEEMFDISDMQYQIDRLRARIDLQRTSQEQIHGILNDQRSLVAATPSGRPTNGWQTSRFGMRRDPFSGKRKRHTGLDIAARTGTPIYATADGVVVRVQSLPGYGKSVTVDHGYGYRTRYAHNSRIYVKVGDRIKRHQKIAAVGNTGRSTGPHLHYEVIVDGVPVNPQKYL